MSREETYQEMEEMFGLVPSFFKVIPDSSGGGSHERYPC